MGRIEILTGVERCRRWSDWEKLGILDEASVPGTSAAAVARRHDLHPQQIYAWRCRFGSSEMVDDGAATFLPVTVRDDNLGSTQPLPEAVSSKKPPRSKRIEIVRRKGRVLKTDAGIDTVQLGALIRAVEAA